MKEATGELNMTVITVVAIAAVVAIFMAFILPSIQDGMALNAACSSANGGTFTTTTEKGTITCQNGSCSYQKENGSTSTKSC